MYSMLRKFGSVDDKTENQKDPEDSKDTANEDALKQRIEQLEDKQRKIMIIAGITIGVIILVVIVNGITENTTEKAWGVGS